MPQNRHAGCNRARFYALPRQRRSHTRLQHLPPPRLSYRMHHRSYPGEYHHCHHASRNYDPRWTHLKPPPLSERCYGPTDTSPCAAPRWHCASFCPWKRPSERYPSTRHGDRVTASDATSIPTTTHSQPLPWRSNAVLSRRAWIHQCGGFVPG